MLSGLRSTRVRVFLVYLLSYIAVLCVPITLGALLYDRSVRSAERQGLESLLAIVENNARFFDARITEVRGMLDIVLLNEAVRNVLKEPQNAYLRYRAVRVLEEYALSSRFVEQIALFMPADDLLVTSTFSVTDAARFYGAVFSGAGLDYASWRTALGARTFAKEFAVPILVSSSTGQKLMDACLLSVPGTYSLRPGVIMVLIDHEEMLRAVGAARPANGTATIMGGNGETLFAAPGDRQMPSALARVPGIVSAVRHPKYVIEGDAVTFLVPLSRTGWVYRLAIPRSHLIASTKVLRGVFAMVLSLTVVLGSAVAWFLASVLGRPVGDALEALPRWKSGRAGPAGFIRSMPGSVAEVMKSNQELAVYVEGNLPIIRDNVVGRLMAGTFRDQRELSAADQNARLALSGSSFVVALIRIETYRFLRTFELYEDMDRLKLTVRRFLAERDTAEAERGARVLSHEVDGSVLAALFVDPSDGAASLASGALGDFIAFIGPGLRSFLCVGYGRPVSSPLDVYRSYADARRALEFAGRFGCGSIVSFDEVSARGPTYHYPLDVEARLMGFVKSGDRERSLALLDEIEAEHRAAYIGGEAARYLAEGLRGTFMRLRGGTAHDDPVIAAEADAIASLDSFDTIDELFARAKSLTARLCDLEGATHASRDTRLADDLRRHVSSHFLDAQFCFSRLAEHYRMGEAAMSRLFKQLTGETFSLLIDRLRMQHARELLETRGMSVAEVARAVCYSTPQSFRRAYKRFHGRLPGIGRVLQHRHAV